MITVYKDISECLTLDSAYKKQGRHITDSDLSIIKNAAIVVKKDRIAWVGEFKKLPTEYKKAKKVSLEGRHVVPAFLECHTHSVFAGNRASEFEMKCQGRNYAEIAQAGGGIVSTVKQTRLAKEKDLKDHFEKVCLEFLKQGVTTLEIKSGYGLNLKDELKILKVARKHPLMRTVTTYLGPHAKPPEFSSVTEYFETVMEDLDKVKKSGLADRVDIFIEKNYFEPQHAKSYFEKAKKLGFQVVSHTHQLNPSNGIQVSVNQGALSCDHLNYIETSDIELLSKSHATGVLIPTADFYLKLPYPPARKLLNAGVRVALTTDFNPGSSPTQNLNFVGLIARRELGMTLSEVICAWTVSSSFALGLESELGSLSVGKFADFLVLKGHWQELFYRVGENQIQSVYKVGRKLKLT